MSGKDHVAGINEEGTGEAEGLDRVGNLPDLLARVGAGIARLGLEHPKGQGVDGEVSHGRRLSCEYFNDPS